MTDSDSSNNPPKRVAKGVSLPFTANPIMAAVPVVIVLLISAWIYFSGSLQLMLGLRELKEKNHEAKAIEYLNWAIASNPDLAEAYALRAKARLNLEQEKGANANYSAAKNDIARAIKLAPKNNEYYATMMEIEVAAHNYRTAIAGYTHLIDLNDPNQVSYLNKRARLYYILARYEDSRADRERIIKIETAFLSDVNRERKLPLEERARQYVFIGEIDKAVNDYEECVKSDPNGDDLLRLGYLYENSGRPSQAIEAYTKLYNLLKDDENHQLSKALFRRANLHLNAGENDKALTDADLLLRSRKTDLHHVFHANILDIVHRTEAAQAERKTVLDQFNFSIEDILKDAPDEVLADQYIDRAKFYATDKQWKKALKDYSIALSLHPEPSTYIACAQMYTKLGDYNKAIALFTKEILPEIPDCYREDAYSGLAEIHLLQNKPELAVRDGFRGVAQGAETGAASYWRAKAYKQLGTADLAKIDEQQALGLGYLPVKDLD